MTEQSVPQQAEGNGTPSAEKTEESRKAAVAGEAAAAAPAPVGDPSHPAIVIRDGFYFFRDDYQLPDEPAVENAIAVYLAEVEKAFENRWPLHPNLMARRDDAQKITHAYELDFRENEIKRIRAVLPVDKLVFDLIDALVDVVMLENLKIYARKRLEAFWHVVRNTKLQFGIWLAVLLAVLLAANKASGGNHIPFDVPHWGLVVFAAIVVAVLATRVTIGRLTWRNIIERNLRNTKEKYEEAVRDATGLAATKLAKKGRDIEGLMFGLKNRLDTINSADITRVQQADKLVRVLLWNPERMGLIENYYRAKMDQFMVRSARVSIDGTVTSSAIIRNRQIFLSVSAVFLVIGLAVWELVAFLCRTGGCVHEAVAPTLSFKVALVTALLMLAVSVTAAVCSVVLARLTRRFEPVEVERHESALFKNGMLAAAGGAVVGLAPFAVSLLVGQKEATLVAIVFLVVFALVVVCEATAIMYAQWIFRKHEHQYNSNVLEAVERKMDASQWTRYSDLRIDQRIAEVFKAIYSAWHKADSRGVYGNQQNGNGS